jgi:hypothetical protein
LQGVKATRAILPRNYSVWRCCRQYPLSCFSKPGFTNNYFAVSQARGDRLPNFLVEQRFLVPS